LAAIFSRTDLIQEKKKRPNAYRQTKIFGRQWRPEISHPALIHNILIALITNDSFKQSVED
jgi:hypothetical protein